MDPSPTPLEMPEPDDPPLELLSTPPSVEAPPTSPIETPSVSGTIAVTPAEHAYPSLYDGTGTTMVAVLLGIGIIGGIQWGVARIFRVYREEHRALTAFATAMVGLVVGIYVCDMLIAGPTAELLSEGERLSILGFVEDTALMVFAYYFGTKAQVPTDLPRE